MPAIFPPGTSVLATLRSLASRGDLYAESILAITNNTYWPSVAIGTEASNIIRLAGQVKDQDGSSVAAVKQLKMRATLALGAFKTEVVAASAAALPTVTASGTGVGKTLTSTAHAALTLDGVVIANGDRILVKDQVTGADNGIYTQTTLGDGSTSFILTRATDSDTAGENLANVPVFVRRGAVNAGKTFVHVTAGAITMETTALVYKDKDILITMALGAAGATVKSGSGSRELWLATSATGGFSVDVTSDATWIGGVLIEAVTDNGETELNVITFA